MVSRARPFGAPAVQVPHTDEAGELVGIRYRTELGVSRCAAEAIMRKLPIITIDGVRKTYVRRLEAQRYLEERTVPADARR